MYQTGLMIYIAPNMKLGNCQHISLAYNLNNFFKKNAHMYLTHGGLMVLYGNTDLGQHWIR